MKLRSCEDLLSVDISKVGINIHPAASEHYGLDPWDILNEQLSWPNSSVSLAFPHDRISVGPNEYDFNFTDRVVESVLKAKKKIRGQFGAKTKGWPEVRVAPWMLEKFSYIQHPGVIDKDPEFRKRILDYEEVSLDRYKRVLEVVQFGNEARSKRLGVTCGRYESTDFNNQEIAQGKKIAPEIPVFQNLPWDTPEAWPNLLRNSQIDILALNVYNNTRFRYLWRQLITFAGLMAFSAGKELAISEMQLAPWIEEDGEPKYPYSKVTFAEDFIRTVKNPLITFCDLWDSEQIIWKAVYKRVPQYFGILNFLRSGDLKILINQPVKA